MSTRWVLIAEGKLGDEIASVAMTKEKIIEAAYFLVRGVYKKEKEIHVNRTEFQPCIEDLYKYNSTGFNEVNTNTHVMVRIEEIKYFE